jgi:hypothetical protein
MNKNLTAAQLGPDGKSKYAYFLPATSSFYATFIGKQRYHNYVDPARIPKAWTEGVESLNYLDPERGLFYYDHCLYSAGHANLDLTKQDDSEDMFRNRDRSTSWVLGDSGGFQIGKGVWGGEWNDPTGPEVQARMAEAVAKGVEIQPVLDASGAPVLDKKGNPKTLKIDHVKIYQAKLDAAQKKREQVLNWMDSLMDYGIVLDVPAWVAKNPVGSKNTGVSSYAQAVAGTKYNNEYFIKHRTGKCKFLNVLHGERHDQADHWYNEMKHFCDTKIYGDRAFNGWAMGGKNCTDVHLVLKRLVALRFDGLLETGQHDWMHFLGTSKLEWALLSTDIQRVIRKYHNENFTVSFDCASPFLATANGQIYVETKTDDRKKWSYRMLPSIDDKKYANDTRLFRDAVIQDGHFKVFENSPVIDTVEAKDICIYGPNDLNKLGKIGTTSWDSFSYAIMMGHNVWHHANCVQEANRQYDAGLCPAMLVDERFDRTYFRDVLDAIFATNDRAKAEKIIEDHSNFWMLILGSRGSVGKNIISAKTHFANLFEEVDPNSQTEFDEETDAQVEFEELDEEDTNKLDQLEDQVKHDPT